jgi:hypothetical protein
MWSRSIIRKPINPTLVACGAFAVFIIVAIVTRRCLYADGSYYFLEVLKTGSFTAIINCRSFANYLFELPVVASLSLGIHGIAGLAILYGVGCFCAWPVAMLLCYLPAPRHFWIVMLACAAGYLNAAFVAVGEHIVAHAFFWPALFAILYVRPLTPFAAVTLLGSTILLMRSYESMLFLGPLLIALVIWRMMRDRENLWRQAVLTAAIVFLVAATFIALGGVEHPNPINYNGFKHGPITELHNPTWTLQMSVLWTVIMLLSLYSRAAKFLRSPVGLILTISIVLFWGAWPLLAPRQLDPESQYECRFLELLVPLVLAPVAVALAVRPKWFATQIPDLTRLAAMMLVAQSLWQISATHQWQRYIADWQRMLGSGVDGPIVISNNDDFGKFDHLYFTWANPCLSLMLGPTHVQTIIMPSQPGGWMPFNPFNPKSLPNLKRYRVDYSEYIEALRQQKLIQR